MKVYIARRLELLRLAPAPVSDVKKVASVLIPIHFIQLFYVVRQRKLSPRQTLVNRKFRLPIHSLGMISGRVIRSRIRYCHLEI